MGVTDDKRREILQRNQEETKTGMKSALIAGLVTLAWASPAPQYSGQTEDLSEGQLDTIKDIFGTDAGDAYSGQGAQGTGDPEQVQPVQRLLAAHRRCSPDHRWQRIC